MNPRIHDLTADRPDWLEQAAVLLYEAFHGRSREWQDLDSARQEVAESLSDDRISRVAVDDSNAVIGWIGGIPNYHGNVWEIHPLVVVERCRHRGVGRALVHDLEDVVRPKGALTLFAGSDDENNETTLAGVDLYGDVPAAIRQIRNLAAHPFEFYVRLGFSVVGVLPDANGPGKPDIFLAKPVQAAR